MGLKRKEIKRGRKAGPASVWISAILGAERPSRPVKVRLGDVFAYDADGALLPADDARVFTYSPAEFAVPPRVNGAIALTSPKDATLEQTQARLGAQIRGVLAKVESDASWLGVEPDERTAAQVKADEPNALAGITVLAVAF